MEIKSFLIFPGDVSVFYRPEWCLEEEKEAEGYVIMGQNYHVFPPPFPLRSCTSPLLQSTLFTSLKHPSSSILTGSPQTLHLLLIFSPIPLPCSASLHHFSSPPNPSSYPTMSLSQHCCQHCWIISSMLLRVVCVCVCFWVWVFVLISAVVNIIIIIIIHFIANIIITIIHRRL